MGIYKVKKGIHKGKWRVMSYVTGNWHKRVYNSYASALKASGTKSRHAYYKKKKKS